MAKKSRKRKRIIRKLVTLLMMAAFVAVTSFSMVKGAEFIMERQQPEETPRPTPTPLLQQPNTDITYNPDTSVQTINLGIDETPEIDMIRVPTGNRVDLSYFDDVIFLGDSLADGFRVYSSSLSLRDTGAVYLTQKSMTPRSFMRPGVKVNSGNGYVDVWQTIAEKQPGKMYVTLGTNALMGMTPEDFVESYKSLINKIRETTPHTVIYVSTVTPTTHSKALTEPRLSFDRIYRSNLLIAKMCRDYGLGLINLYDVLKNDRGYLRPEIAARDGYHLTPSGYGEWLDYLVTHTLYHPSYPYIEEQPAEIVDTGAEVV